MQIRCLVWVEVVVSVGRLKSGLVGFAALLAAPVVAQATNGGSADTPAAATAEGVGIAKPHLNEGGVSGWLHRLDDDFSNQIVRRLAQGTQDSKPVRPSAASEPGSRPSAGGAKPVGDGDPLKAVEDQVGEWIGQAQDWLAKASRAYQSNVMRPLSGGTGGEGVAADKAVGDLAAEKAAREQHRREVEQKVRDDLLARKKQEDDLAAQKRQADEERVASEARQREAEQRQKQELADRKRAEDERAASKPENTVRTGQDTDRNSKTDEEVAAAKAAELKRLADELAAKRKVEEEAVAKAAVAKAAEQKRLADEAAAKRKADQEAAVAKATEQKRLADEAAAKRKADQEAAAAKVAEQKRLADEAAAKRKADQEAATAKAAEQKRLADAVAAKRKADQEAAAKRKADQEAAAAKAVEQKRLGEEAAAKRKADQEAAVAKATEQKRLADAAAAKRKADQEAAAAKVAEQKRLADEAAAKRKADQEAAVAKRKVDQAAARMAVAATAAGNKVLADKGGRAGEGRNTGRPAKISDAGRSGLGAASLARSASKRPHRERCRNAGRTVKPPATYVVIAGDNLWSIAERHYDAGGRFPVIVRANRSKIADPDLIYPCQHLYLPARRRH